MKAPVAVRLALAAAALLPLALPAPAAEGPDFQKLMDEKSPAIVMVKYSIKMSFGANMGDQESNGETAGVMIDPKGVVMVSQSQMSGPMGMVVRMMGRMGGGAETVPSPTNLRILTGPEGDGLEAKLLAKDSDLDLAWIRIKDPGGKTFPAIDLAKTASGAAGERVFMVRRLNKFFDREAALVLFELAGKVKKPRELYVPNGAVQNFGLPVFNLSGELIGFSVMQAPDPQDGGGGTDFLGPMMGLQDSLSGMILPAAEAAKAAKQALESPEPAEAPKAKE